MDASVYDEIIRRLDRIERLVTPKSRAGTLMENVDRVLMAAKWPMAAAKIAQEAGISNGAARLVLYDNPDKYEKINISEHRRAWKLRAQPTNQQEQT